jgi:hypothetical protein
MRVYEVFKHRFISPCQHGSRASFGAWRALARREPAFALSEDGKTRPPVGGQKE